MEIRTYRKGDQEAIVELWNRRVAGCFATPPLTAGQFVADVVSKVYFEPEGLVLAFEGQRLRAFVHAGFKSSDYIRPDHRAGTISMVAVDDGAMKAGLACLKTAVRYLFAKGARLVEAFTIDFPKTPFYNGLYGGEKAGMDEDHPLGMELMKRGGFNISNGAVIMTCDLAKAPPVPPMPAGYQIRIGEWDSPMKGLAATACYGIPERIRRADLLDSASAVLGGITFWHLDRYNRASGDHMAVVSHVGLAPTAHGTGAAAALQGEVHRILQSEGATRMGLGTGGGAVQAVRFYRKMGYETIKPAYFFHLDWRQYEEYQ
jgi:GNAT superfamily N-acetyltransferase